MSARIKICGLFRPEDAQAANAAMPDYAGFVFHEQSRRVVTPEQAKTLRGLLHDDIRTVGVFVDAPMALVARLYQDKTISAAQLHGNEDEVYIAALRSMFPTMEIWKAFKIRTEAALASAARSTADVVLLDGGAGEGKAFDWGLLSGFPRPYILAGGLTPETITEAIARLYPFAVDLSSGVETDGLKDAAKMLAAVRAARRDDV